MTSATLPQDYQLRAPTDADLDAVADLLVTIERERFGKATQQAPARRAWIASVWETPGFDVARDVRVVVAPSGEIVAYATLWRSEPASSFLVTSPRVARRYQPLGLDAALLAWAEPLARQMTAALPPSEEATLNSWVDGPDPDAADLFSRAGFHLAQRYLRMELTMQTPPPAPMWPAGIAARPFAPGADERAVYDLMNASFAETPGYHPWPFDEWSREVFAPESSDTSLWSLAAQGATLVGASINRLEQNDEGSLGWVEDIGVHPAWRKRGLGLAMLYHSFGAFYQRGVTRCGLSVDAQNVSGATRLYERAGMTAMPRETLRYEKPLR
jgi:ribosomal protein S18 acetylase RimI-like enzyme